MSATRLSKSYRDLNAFRSVMLDYGIFIQMTQDFPDEADEVIQIVLTQKSEFLRLIPKLNELEKVLLAFPVYADAFKVRFLALILEDEDLAVFRQYFTGVAGLILAAKLFPEHVDTLVRKVLHHPDIFVEWCRFDSYSGLHADSELSRAAKKFPQHADRFLQIVLNNPTLLRPSRTRTQIEGGVNSILSCTLFPNRSALFFKGSGNDLRFPTTQALYEAARDSVIEIRKNARMMAQGFRGRYSNQLRFFDENTCKRIAVLSGDNNIHPEEAALTMVNANFSKPVAAMR